MIYEIFNQENLQENAITIIIVKVILPTYEIIDVFYYTMTLYIYRY